MTGHNLLSYRKIRFCKCGVCGKTIFGAFSRRWYCSVCKKSFHYNCKARIAEECPCLESDQPFADPLSNSTTTTTSSGSSSSNSSSVHHEDHHPGCVDHHKCGGKCKKQVDDVADTNPHAVKSESEPDVIPAKYEHAPLLVKELLNKYGEKDPVHPGEIVIGPQGLLDLCAALDIDLLDIKGLILLWLANASDGGMLTCDELCNLVTALPASTVSEIVPGLYKACDRVNSSLEELEKMFDYGFISCKEQSYSRTVDANMCAQMLEIVLANREQFHHVKTFAEFLSCGQRQKVNADEWHCVFNFCLKFGDDLSSYDDTSSWPCLIDEFVEYVRSKAA